MRVPSFALWVNGGTRIRRVIINTSKGTNMKTKLTKKAAKAVKTITQRFTDQELPGFVAWMKEQWEANPPAILATNPPNHSYDIEDGTHDVSIGEKAVAQKRKHHQDLSGGIFAYRIRCDDDLRTVLRSLEKLSSDDKQEAAMAFLIEYRNGSYVENEKEWREVGAIVGNKDCLDNPFYKGVCEAILEVFRKEGWIA